ncbi:MAG: alpha/beta hydrolase [Tannerella sp.]|jgi:acetyl esterase/lipase|nr:alpha/beta hydrolase [Tannerella sp.]
MKTRNLLLTGWMLFSALSAFSQDSTSEKHDFKYKSANRHDIMATIYLPKSDEKVPVLIYYHGGGFMFGNRHQGLESTLRDKLLDNNIAVVSADYRLAPETKLDEILKDVHDIVAWIKKEGGDRFNIDTNKIAVAGGSAGGYLALTTGFNPQYAPDAIISISAPTGFSTEGIQAADLSLLADTNKDSIISHGDYTTRIDLWRNLGKNGLALYEIFGFDPVKEPQKLEQYTLTNNIKAGYPPTLIIHAKNDRAVKFDDAEAFYMFLQDRNVKSELYVVENGHASSLIEQHPESIDKIITFLNIQFNK